VLAPDAVHRLDAEGRRARRAALTPELIQQIDGAAASIVCVRDNEVVIACANRLLRLVSRWGPEPS
jgi:hypothetical protein